MTTTLDKPPGSVSGAPLNGARRSMPAGTGRAHRLWRGRETDPAWSRPAFLALLAGTAVLYFWSLGESGWANSFYSAAAQAGSESWKALFFGSSDAANAITVDKPPASLWFMAASVRVFGLSSWSILAPQALMGVATVAVLHSSVKRRLGPGAGLIAGATLALTPVATLMFRFNNPDALLVLIMTIAAALTLRAIETGRARYILLVGVLIGFGFLTKQLQALLVVPAFGLAYLWAAPKSLVKRVRDLAGALVALIVAAGWWIAIVELTPASLRPYIGGSQTNSILELTFGYNGFGRLTGDETGSVGGGGNGGWGTTGLSRLFDSDQGGQIAWLLPAALILMIAGFWVTRRAPRTSLIRAAFIVWGGWLVITGVVFSEMQGIFHAYYTVALAPAIAALVGLGSTLLWKQRAAWAPYLLAVVLVVTTLWSYTLLARSGDFVPWLRVAVLVIGLLAAAGLAAGSLLGRRALAVVAATAVIVGLAGPAAYSLQTASTGHTGSIVTAGPSTGGMGGMGGGRGGGGGMPGGQAPTGTGTGTGTGTTTRGGFGGGGGGMGGLLSGTTPSAELTTALDANASDYTWVAATVGSNNASGYQLATEDPVMAIGGFNGTDAYPTLAQFQQYVQQGKIHYFIASGLGGTTTGGTTTGGSDVGSQITQWVEANYTATTIGGTTVYDLTQ